MRHTLMVFVVGLIATDDRDHRRVVQIVVPHGIETKAARLDRPHEIRELRLVLGYDDDISRPCGEARRPGQFGDHMGPAAVIDVLGRVEPQAIKMELLNPIGGIADHKIAWAVRVRPVEVQRCTPIVLVDVGEIMLRERVQHVASRTDMIVDDVKDDPDANPVSMVDKRSEIVGCAIEPRRREPVDAVVAPAEPPNEVVNWHHFDDGDAEVLKEMELVSGRPPCALRSESAHVHLVEHLIIDSQTGPLLVAPSIDQWIDDLRGTLRSLRLETRGRVVIEGRPVVEPELVVSANCEVGDYAMKITVPLQCQFMLNTMDHHRDGCVLRRPDPKRYAVWSKLRSGRKSSANRLLDLIVQTRIPHPQ